MEKFFKDFSITTGVVWDREVAYLLATKDSLSYEKIPHTRIYEIDQGTVGGEDLNWTAVSASICYMPKERFIAIGEVGFVEVFGGGQIIEEQPITKSEVILREVRGIAKGRAYAVGPAHKVFRRDAPNQWKDISAPFPKIDDLMDAGFESIDGFSETDIYAVGWGGDIWHYNGKIWTQIESPTNLALYKVRCGEDGYVYACGQIGILLRGKGNQWSIIKHDTTEEDFWGCEWFNGKLYIATLHLLYVLENGELKLVDYGDELPPTTCYHLSSADGIMWSIGAKDVMEYDGKKWKSIINI